jgi:TRAP-type C4-dicarboxylate transport system permease small subunit
MTKLIAVFDEGLEKLSRYGIIACLFGILVFAVFSIVLRWLGQSLMWIEPLVRHLVFLSAFFGGSLATSKNVHIRIDLLTKLIENSNSKFLKWLHHNLISLFSFLTCLVLMKAAWDFYLVEREYGAVGFLEIHSSTWVGIIPFGVGLISLRFFNQLIFGLLNGAKRESHSL